jgi:hypothetical protein
MNWFGGEEKRPMHKNVIELIRLVPPPPKPRYNRGDWNLVAAELGTDLPQDFKDFNEIYGAVGICDNLWFHAPFYFVGDEAYVPLLSEKESYRELLMSRLHEMSAVTGGRDNVPYPDFPEPGGLLPIGATDNGDLIAWITAGRPEEWGTFFWNFPGLTTWSFPGVNLTGFLISLFDGTSPLFPDAIAQEPFSAECRHVSVVGARE